MWSAPRLFVGNCMVTRLYNNKGSGVFCATWSVPQLYKRDSLKSPKRLGPEKDCAGKIQQHVQKTDPSSRHRGRPTKQDRDCQTVINI
jgi:hypothetical protein